MQTEANLIIISIQLLLIIALIGLFYWQNKQKSYIDDMLEVFIDKIYDDPEPLREIGKGLYTSMTATISAKGSHFKRREAKFQELLMNTIVPPELWQLLPEQIAKPLQKAPEMLPTVIKMLYAFKEGGMQGGVSVITEKFGELLNNSSASQIIQDRLTQVQQKKEIDE